jgi:nucleotide-binding universal stress UspA family protein
MSQPILVAHSPESTDRSAEDFAEEVARLTGAPLAEPTDAAQGLAGAVEELRPALVVLAAGGHAAERLIHGASCPVVVVPTGSERPSIRTIGAAFAPTPEGREALRAAAALAGAFGARLRVVEARSPKHADEAGEGLLARQHHDHDSAEDVATRHTMDADATLEAAIAELGTDVEVETDILVQDPGHALVAASANLDLLVMGSRGRGPIKAVVLGSVSRHVTASASCPVLVLPRGTEGVIEALVPAPRAETSE